MTEIAEAMVATYSYHQIAKSIDHSLLRPELTEAEVIAGCELAMAYDTASVCVRPFDVGLASRLLAGSDVVVGSVIGFPHGSNTTRVKRFEAEDALANGATELDMVLNIGQLRSGHADVVRDDIAAVVTVARGRALVKVILENAYLDDDHKRLACQLVTDAGGDFVKTSTGFAPTGATIEDLTLMRAVTPDHVQIKAAGGIRTLDALIGVLDIGVTRVGATATQAILDDFNERSGRPARVTNDGGAGARSDRY